MKPKSAPLNPFPHSPGTQSPSSHHTASSHSSLSPGSSHCSYLVPSDLDTANCAPPLLALESRPSLVASLHCAHIFVNMPPGSLSDKKRKNIPNSRTALVSGNPSILMKSLILLLTFGRKPGSGEISCCFQRRGIQSYTSIFHTQCEEQEDSGEGGRYSEGISPLGCRHSARLGECVPRTCSLPPSLSLSLSQFGVVTLFTCLSLSNWASLRAGIRALISASHTQSGSELALRKSFLANSMDE